MINFSRRQIAKYAVEQLSNKHSIASLAKELAAALIVSGRQKEVEFLLSDIDQELEDRGLQARVRVTSAYPLSAKLRSELTAQVKKLADVKEVSLADELDKDLLGGIKVETANHSWDKTLKRSLIDIKEAATHG